MSLAENTAGRCVVVSVHVLPSGVDKRPPDLSQLRYRDRTSVAASMERAYQAAARYLAERT